MEKPIIFSTEMIRAILDGRKTQTRRIIKPQPPDTSLLIRGPEWYEPAMKNKFGELKPGKPIYGIYDEYGEWGIKCPYYPGMVLWVRETWCNAGVFGYAYKATDTLPVSAKSGWRSPRYMNREAARIFLKVNHVRVERLQDITEEDARAEGVKGIPRSRELYPTDDYIYPFKRLWDNINAKRGYGWETNPWVWVIEFRRVNKG